MQLDFEAVRRLLPQRFPLLMIDAVESLTPGEEITAVKNVSGSDIHFLGHFPEQAIFPGVLMVEAAAQAAILLCTAGAAGTDEAGERANGEFLLRSAEAKFLKVVVPGDQLKIHVKVVKLVKQGGIVSYRCAVNAGTVSKGSLSFAVKAGEADGDD